MAQLAKAFRELLNDVLNLDNPDENSKLFYVFYSGRGTGKSENISIILVLAMYNRPNTRVVCIREVQHSIQESVKATLEKWIDELNLTKYFHITGSSLKCHNGSECLFIGLKNSNSPNIKSISNVHITFIEEASQLSEKSWRLLVPSVTRTPNPKIIVAFNPDRETDVIYKEFVANTPPKSSFVKKLTFEDNPFFRNSSLYRVMLDDKERLPTEVFNHIWNGELAKNIEDSLFKKANFEPYTSKEEYCSVVIGVDPATTNNEHSNEYGIIVAAKTITGECRVLHDYTGKYTPHEFTSQVVEAYYLFEADTVVIETNQGGDFIKSAILDLDVSIRIVEVRAGISKQNRALPLANMLETGLLRFAQRLPKLQRQMELTTLRGYLGPKGESPDSLDACVWAIYHLMDIKERDSYYQVFKLDYFTKKIEGSVITSEVQTYISFVNGEYFIIEVAAITTGSKTQLVIKNSLIIEDYQFYISQSAPKYIITADTPQNYNIQANSRYFKEQKTLEEKIAAVLHILKVNYVFIEDSKNSYKNYTGDLLKIALSQYSYETKRNIDALIDLMCDIILLNF